ncbi:hypothetical protein Rhe02_89240 [Rhizocola hellebori]|uniref:Uncharacterized protein n=1 Tax=Rhizocola hellebori TaxID=1392758 RepID=A0A8J3VLN4_9ACTN|nr:hypothetical protein Rhe02_89240 [Rhizocola hellebori]
MLLLLTGCSSAPTPGGGTETLPTKEPVTVMVARTGGFAGVMDTITIKGDGSWTHPTALTVNGKLEPAQVTQLQKLATDPRLVTEAAATPAPTKCNDTFDYTVTAGAVTISYTDCPSDVFQPVATKQLVEFVQDVVS